MEQEVPAISGIDTRELTKKIRDQGAMLSQIRFDTNYVSGDTAQADPHAAFTNPNARNLVAEVSRTVPQTYGAGGSVRILAVDCGMKYNIIRNFVERDCEVKVVPWDYDFNSEAFDGEPLGI